MPDEPPADRVPSDTPDGALAYLEELQPDLRAAALLSASGEVLAAVPADAIEWLAPARRLVERSEMTGLGDVVEVHVATRDGEVLAVREAGRLLIVVAERFVLASLLTFDMRMSLRRAERGSHAA